MKPMLLAFLVLLIPVAASADTLLIFNSSGEIYAFDTVTKQVTPAREADIPLKDFDAYYRDQSGNNPQPPEPPEPPDDPDGFAAKVQAWSEEVDDPDGAAVFGEGLWATLASEMKRGQIPTDANTVNKAISQALDKATRLYGSNKREWEDFHDKVLRELSQRLLKSGNKLTQAQYAEFFSDVAAGLEASKGDAVLDDIIDELIAVLIRAVIRILQDLFAQNEYDLHELSDILFELSWFMPARKPVVPRPRLRNRKGA